MPSGFQVSSSPGKLQQEIEGRKEMSWRYVVHSLSSYHGHLRLASCPDNGTAAVRQLSLYTFRSPGSLEPRSGNGAPTVLAALSPVVFLYPSPSFYRWSLIKFFSNYPIWVCHLFLAGILAHTYNHDNMNNECWLNQKLMTYWEVREKICEYVWRRCIERELSPHFPWEENRWYVKAKEKMK